MRKKSGCRLAQILCRIKKVGNRGYTTGFALGNNDSSSYSYDISKGLAGADFLCEFKGEKIQTAITL